MVRLSKKLTSPTAIAIATIILVIVGFLIFLLLHNSENTGSGTIPSTTTAKSGDSTTNSSNDKQVAPSTSSSDNTDKNKSEANTTSGSGSLVKPYGSFVSNHHPNLSGSPAPSQMQSVCNTTPGASCTILFTKDSVVKTLKAQIVDSNGATYWTWDVNDAGLTEGQWQITAKATLESGSESSTDSQFLEVRP